jgi:hypothetical protein
MTSLFQVIAHEDGNDKTALRKAAALAANRVEERFGRWLRQGSSEDQAARWELVRDDVLAVVAQAFNEMGAGDPEVITANLLSVDGGPYHHVDGIAKSASKNRVIFASHQIHEARKPKMCPYHSEVVDISLADGSPQAGYSAMAQHAWSAQHCQGGDYEGGKCNFKPAMTTQSYWDEKAERAEERKREREEQAELNTQNFETPVEAPAEAEDTDQDPIGGGESKGVSTPELESPEVGEVATPEVEVPMSMAASTPKGSGLEKLAPGKQHLPYATDKENRMYEHIKSQCMADGGDEESCKREAAATVNKYRSEHGETKSHRVADTEKGPNVTEGPGEPSPKMDRRKWTPATVPHTPPGIDSDRHPTKNKDATEPIKAVNDDKLDEIGEKVTEHQDVTKDGGPSHSGQGGTFPRGRQADPVTSGFIPSDKVHSIISKYRGS